MSGAAPGAGPRWVRLAPLAALPLGQAVAVDVDGDLIALFHTCGGLRAVTGTCPHAGGPLADGEFDEVAVTCPWHRWSYDLHTGQRRDRKGQPLDVHQARIIDEWIWLAAPAGRG